MEVVSDKPCRLDCICPAMLATVCGTDGKTQPSKCTADCAGVEIDYEGECVSESLPELLYCGCPKELKRVCGVDNKTYPNSCRANCFDVKIASEGRCAVRAKSKPIEPCACPKDMNPVCGTDERTYDNKCLASCAKVEVASDGHCPKIEVLPDPNCICPAIYDPVCGKDGKTWGSGCNANCAGVKVAYEGECFAPGPTSSPSAPCTCPENKEAVCGTDDKSYSSSCVAKCVGIKVKHAGSCGQKPGSKCACPFNFAPVCGEDGKTYDNACAANCEDVKIVRKSACPSTKVDDHARVRSCKCPKASGSARVCGTNPVTKRRNTYSSMCHARCAKATDVTKGGCSGGHSPSPKTPAHIPPCPCPKDQKFVCGTLPFNPDAPSGPTNVTFGNLCEAGCSNATIIDNNGACVDDPSVPTLPPSAATCSCFREDDPVCDIINNVTYQNPCLAACAKAGLTVPGACKPLPLESDPNACVCIENFDPVCGNGTTFSNVCQAACVNVTSYTKGACIKD